MLKPSKYNYHTYTNDGEMLLMNTLSGRLVKFQPDQARSVSGYLSKNTDDENAVVNFLQKRGILVNVQVDEHLKVKNLFAQIQSKPILTLTLLPTEQCNFRCVYCPESFKRAEMLRDVQGAIIDYVRENIHKYTGVIIAWFGGEPLLAMDVITNLSTAIMQICKEKNKTYASSISTNAYLLSVNTFRLLLQYHVFKYQITIDGLKETHDRQRCLQDGSPTYDVIVDNLLQIKQTVHTGKFQIMLRINVSKSMISQIPQYISWYKRNFGNDRRFCLLIKRVSDYGGEMIHSFSEEIILDNSEEKVFFDSLLSSDLYRCSLVNRSFFSRGGMLCSACMQNALLIDSQGNIRKCTCHLDDDVLNLFGNISGRNIENNDNYVRWNEPLYNKKCDNCFFYPICMSSYCKYKSILTQKTCCPDEKRQIGKYLEIFNKQGVFETMESLDRG